MRLGEGGVGRTHRRGKLALMAALALAAACGRGTAEVPRGQVERDLADLEESLANGRAAHTELDAIEARLLSGRATVRLWQELATRHQGVSEIACKNLDVHVAGLAASERKDRARLARHRLAQSARPAVATDAHVSGYRTAPAAAKASGAGTSKLAP